MKSQNLVFTNQNLENADFSKRDLRGASFLYCNLKNANFSESTLVDASFLGCELQKADFSYSIIKDTKFDFSNLKGVELQNTSIINISLWKAKGIFQFNAFGEIPCYAILHKKCIMVQVEFYSWLSIKQFESRFGRKDNYRSQILYLKDLEKRIYKT